MAYQVLIPQDVAPPQDYLRERDTDQIGSGITADPIAADVVDCDAILARRRPSRPRCSRPAESSRSFSRHGVRYDNIDVARRPVGHMGDLCAGIQRRYGRRARHRLHFHLGAQFHPTGYRERAPALGDPGPLLRFDLFRQSDRHRSPRKISRRVAQKASRGLDMKVVGYDPFLEPEQVAEFAPATSMEEVFGAADFLTLHIPGSASTEASSTESCSPW